jgi:predicted enzyme related to lactoylglutathione lyase
MKNLISWVEIPATDFQRAVKFYSTILNTELQVIEGENEQMACFPGGEGAISKAEGYQPSKQGVVVSLNAGENLDEVLKKISANGGSILQPKTKIEAEGRGYFAVFLDCEGNRLGLYGDR